MKYTSYKQVREATLGELCDIDPDDYTDEELWQVQKWMIQAQQEAVSPENLIGMTSEDVELLGLDNENLMNCVIGEAAEEFTIDGKKIIGRKIIDYPEFSIVKADDKNDYYRIMH